MFRLLLLLLGATILLEGANANTDRSELDLSSCQPKFYGKTYSKLYMNFMSDKFTICFSNYYDTNTVQDCIVGPPLNSTSIDSDFPVVANETRQEFQQNLQSVSNRLTCTVRLIGNSDKNLIIILAGFGTESGLLITTSVSGTSEFDIRVNNVTVDTLVFQNVSGEVKKYLDISGCRQSDSMFTPGELVTFYKFNCTTFVCSDNAVITENTCGTLERCQSNGFCILDPTCTVTGPSVIDFKGQVNTVDDRCTYTLWSSTYTVWKVLGKFQERRRKDVVFLDSMILIKTNETFYLEQGGKVWQNSKELSLTKMVQVFEGLQLSKDTTGVNAKVTFSGFTLSIFFDGYTAQISVTGNLGQNLDVAGICSNTNNVNDSRSLYSSLGCNLTYSDSPDSMINCSVATDRCNLLMEDPFKPCHTETQPKPYIDACKKTLCAYPAVDGLNCQFFEAYVRACQPRINETLENWRPNMSCTATQSFCQDKICSDKEYCAETVTGEIGCFCRAIFASPYREEGTYGEPAICQSNSASITLIGCLLEEKGIDYWKLHLNDENCTGQIDSVNHRVTFNFNSSKTCGMKASSNRSLVIFQNTVMDPNSTIEISRHDKVSINFSCHYSHPANELMSFKIKDNSVIQQVTSGPWSYTVTMKAYTDEFLKETVERNTSIQLDQKIWVKLMTYGLDSDLVAVVTDSCWATNLQSSTQLPKYYLIRNGCANGDDKTVKVEGNGNGTSNYFSFQMFQFFRSSREVYLHCKLTLCALQNGSCIPVCNNRRRRFARSQYIHGATSLISMIWTK